VSQNGVGCRTQLSHAEPTTDIILLQHSPPQQFIRQTIGDLKQLDCLFGKSQQRILDRRIELFPQSRQQVMPNSISSKTRVCIRFIHREINRVCQRKSLQFLL
jgi:hypothetical protein